MKFQNLRFYIAATIIAGFAFVGCNAIKAETLGGASLDQHLRQGGYVILMRHASSPMNPPNKTSADPDNPGLERQLDENGRRTAVAMGRAFKSLHIPVGAIFSSPNYRALETVRLGGFDRPRTVVELGDQGRSMARIDVAAPARWLKAKVAEKPAPGTNTLIVTHMPNIAAAFPDLAAGLQDGEALIFRPDGHGHADMMAKVPIEDWGG